MYFSTCHNGIRFEKEDTLLVTVSVTDSDSPKRMTNFHRNFEPKDLKRSEDKCRVSLGLPGFTQTDYGRDGNLTMQSLMLISSSGEAIPMGTDSNLSMLGFRWQGYEDTTTFSLNFEMDVTDAIYDSRICKTELLGQYSLIHVGKSSMKMLCQMFTKDNPSEPILSYVHQIVRVDFNTRKPTPWPTWISELFQKRQGLSAGPDHPTSKRLEMLTRPANTFVYNVHVAWSDTDENAHCNFASYAKFADDGLRAALRLRDNKQILGEANPTSNSQCHQLGVTTMDKFVLYQGNPSLALGGIRKDIIESGVKHFQIHFFQECLEDDLLHVHIWQDGVKDNVVFVSLEKDDQVVSQIVMEYFTSKSKL